MDKRLKWSLATAAVVTATLTSVEVANANESGEQTVPPRVASETKQAVGVTKAQVDTAKASVDTAKEKVDTATTTNKTANEAVQQTSQQVTNATKAVAEAEANQNASAEAIKGAEQAVTTAQQQVDEATAQHSVSKDQVATAKQDAETKAVDVKKAEKDVHEQEATVATSQKKVEQAEQNLRGANETTAKEAVQKANDAVEAAKTEVASAERTVETAKNADKARSTEITNAEEAVKTATTDNAVANKTVADKEAEVTSSETTVKTAQKAFDDATAQLKALTDQVINTITLNDSYIKALKSDDEATLAKINEELNIKHKFKSNEADKLRKIDVRNLTDEQKRELSLFAADLINQVRKQYGSPLVKVTKGAIDFANTVVRKDEANGYQMDDGHDVEVIKAVARDFGLDDRSGRFQFYENLFSYGFNDDEYENEYKHLGVNADQFYTKTMDEAKERIYASMKAFLFDGYEWQHARSILGYTNEPAYFGVAIGHGLAVGKTHFELVRPDYIDDPSKFDTTEVELDNPTARIEKAKDAVKQAEDTLNTAKAELGSKQTALENAKSKADETNKALETAKERLEAAKAVKEQTPEAMAQLAAAKDNLVQAEAAKEVADENLKALSKSKEEKEQAFADTKSKLASDKDELAKRQGILATVEKTYAEAAETLKTAE
ncbi:SEC10/PgrA surface exclusion domain-containing protein, partial [Streptococcus oralis]|uniref:SEC10/PgrA surface exclusion domain-containing protein n=1 Tax=Streptococcus oralis TaxID=1303 RepID=UPI00077D8AE7